MRVAVHPSLSRLILVAALVSAGPRVTAQERPADGQLALTSAVDAYLGERFDEEAEDALDAILQREDATPEALRDALVRCPSFEAGTHEHGYVFLGREYTIRVVVPEGHGADKVPLSLLFCVGRGQTGSAIRIRGVVYAYITFYVNGRDVRQFSDEARDIVLRAAHFVAHRYNADRIWLSGYSWGAHASYDTAAHRPGFLRGIAPTGGGPRRVHFRLRRNMQDITILAYCGEQDDPELVWNLREFARMRKRDKLDYRLSLDPKLGHTTPIQDYDQVPALILQEAPRAKPTRGVLLADMNEVENPLARLVLVDDKVVRSPARLSVSATAKPDQVKRTWIRVLDKKVAKLSWKIEKKADKSKITLRPSGVKTMHVHVRGSHATPGQELELRCGSKTLHKGPVKIDRRAMLEEARRTLQRRDPVLKRFVVKLR